MTPSEAIEAVELAEAEIRYRNQLAAADMYARGGEPGWAESYARAVADVKAVQRGLVLDAGIEAVAGTWRSCSSCRPVPGRLP
jgi:hypothetical protein